MKHNILGETKKNDSDVNVYFSDRKHISETDKT